MLFSGRVLSERTRAEHAFHLPDVSNRAVPRSATARQRHMRVMRHGPCGVERIVALRRLPGRPVPRRAALPADELRVPCLRHRAVLNVGPVNLLGVQPWPIPGNGRRKRVHRVSSWLVSSQPGGTPVLLSLVSPSSFGFFYIFCGSCLSYIQYKYCFLLSALPSPTYYCTVTASRMRLSSQCGRCNATRNWEKLLYRLPSEYLHPVHSIRMHGVPFGAQL